MKKKIISIFISALALSIIFCGVSVNAASYDPGFSTNSDSICLGNLDTDTFIYEKAADAKVEPASTTKIMTYILAVENCDDLDGTMVTVSQQISDSLKDTESSLANLMVGETLSMYELLNCMMVPSGNDAAVVIADHIGQGSVDDFVQMMNDKAVELGCENTHFSNPDGLHGPDHYTTAHDLYTISKYAMSTNRFMEICSQTTHTIPETNMQSKRTLITTNRMMENFDTEYYYPYTKGIKTGWHDQAGRCIVTSATSSGYTYLCVALGAHHGDIASGDKDANGAMLDSANLYRWAFKNFSVGTIATSEEPVTEIGLSMCWGKDSVLLSPQNDVRLLIPSQVSPNSIIFSDINVPDRLNAPVNKGDLIGTASLKYGDIKLSEVNLVSNETVKRSSLLFFLEVLKSIFTSIWFWLAVIILGVLVLIYALAMRSFNRKSRHSKKVKNYRNF